MTATAGTMTGLDGYALAFANSGQLTVSPATLTASIAGDPTKIYDGTTAAALASGNFTAVGLCRHAGRDCSGGADFGAYNSPDVATATTVSS